MKCSHAAAFAVGLLATGGSAPFAAAPQASPPTVSIDFVARLAPSAGRPEPVRQMTFYLLRKSFTDIQRETEQSDPKPNLERFIEGLEVSNELKAWMTRQHSVGLAGPEFVRKLKADDVLEVPEFFDAYVKRNSGDSAAGFPAPKYRAQDKTRHPQKYERQVKEYRKQVRKFLESNPQSLEEIDLGLESINPGTRWAQQADEHRRRVLAHALELAQTRYLVAKTDTDLEGRGALGGIPAGEYWLSTLNTDAVAGDVRVRWDTAMTVRRNQVTRLELSNFNSVPR